MLDTHTHTHTLTFTHTHTCIYLYTHLHIESIHYEPLNSKYCAFINIITILNTSTGHHMCKQKAEHENDVFVFFLLLRKKKEQKEEEKKKNKQNKDEM